ncbi:MAG: ABC transporter substrate-binding protein [Wenzhouxiangellaceae bacterium]|nr:ABC transporter substrate-binding protein [Wenzhouxiangellaceae bacterium]
MKRVRGIAAAALLAGCVLAGLAGCGPASAPGEPEPAVFRYAIEGAPTSLDPAHAATGYADLLVVNLFDTLYRYRYLARPYALAPNLAVGLPEVSDDGLRYVFRIRDDARFVDDPAFADGRGRPVTVHDLIYALKRHFDPVTRSQGAWLWSGRIVGLDAWGERGADYDQPVAGLTALDDFTLEITLTEPYPQLVHTLATGFSALVPREAVEYHGREFGVRPVGSGPFRLLAFDSTRARLAAHDEFQRAPLDLVGEGFDPDQHAGLGLEMLAGRRYPFVDQLEVHFVADNAARWSAFRADELDAIVLPSEQVERVLATRDPIELAPNFAERYRARAGLEAGFIYGGFNMTDPRIGHHPDPDQAEANRELRCAIRDAFDWNARNQAFYGGIAEVFPGIIPPVVPEFEPDLERASVRQNLARGRARLDAAGWNAERLPVLTYGMVGDVQQRQMYEQWRGWLLALGFPPDKVRAETFASFGDYAAALKNRELDVFFLGWLLDYPDAQNTLQLFYGPFETPGSNSVNYQNETFDRLYREAAMLQPGPARTALYQRMNRIVIDDCAAISGLARTRVHIWNKRTTAWPDRGILNGYFLRFVAAAEPGSTAKP